VITVGAVYLVITVLLSALGSRVLSVNISESEVMNYMRYAADGNYDYALQYFETMKPPAAAYAINFLLTAVSGIIGAGFTLFLLNTIRNRQPCFGNLLDAFGFWWKVIVLNLLQSLLVGLWSLLLIVPGVIAYYRYSQAIYILLDDPTKSPLQCLRESKELMRGHKGELFALDLSFLGWYLLRLLPMVGFASRIWSVPYIAATKALFYEQLLGNTVWSFSPDYQ
jgi:uncharacterized membrane protein